MYARCCHISRSTGQSHVGQKLWSHASSYSWSQLFSRCNRRSLRWCTFGARYRRARYRPGKCLSGNEFIKFSTMNSARQASGYVASHPTKRLVNKPVTKKPGFGLVASCHLTAITGEDANNDPIWNSSEPACSAAPHVDLSTDELAIATRTWTER